MKTNDRYNEKEFGNVPDEIKNIKLSKRATDILSGKHDNDPIDPNKHPNIFKLDQRLKKIKTLGPVWDTMTIEERKVWLKNN